MPINEASGYTRSALTRQQKREAEAALFGLQEYSMDQQNDMRPAQEFDLNKPPVPQYIYQEFPRMVYHHATRRARTANNAEELEAALEAGWQKEPFPPEYSEPQLDAAAEREAAEIDARLIKRGPGRPPKVREESI